MVFLARNPDPPEAPAVLPCRLPPCSRPVPLRSALRRTAPASHPALSRPCSRLSLSSRPAVLPCFAPSRICCHLPVPASSPLPRLPRQAFARPHRVAPAIRPLRPTPFSLVPVLALLSHTHLAPPHSRVPAPSNPLLLRPAKPSSGLSSSPPPRYARSASPSGRRRCPALPVPLPPLCLALRRLVPVPPPHLTSAVAFPSPRQARCLACPANPSSGLASLSAPRLPSSRTNLPIPPAPLVPFPLSRTRLPIPPAPLVPPSRLASATAPAPHRPPSPPQHSAHF